MDRITIMQKVNNHGLELDDLRVLQSLYETRNTTRTAERLNKSQPGVSRVLARLRRSLGDPLLVRAPGGMVLTDRALALREQLFEVLTSIEGFLAPAVFDPATSTTVYRLTTTDYGALAMLPNLMAHLSGSAPGIGIEVLGFGADAMRQLGEGQTDLVFYTDDPVPEGLRARHLYAEDYACLVRHDHPILQDGPVTVEAFLNWPQALIAVFGGRTGVVDDALALIGQARKISLWIPYFATAATIIAASDMVLTLPTRAARQLVQPGRIARFPAPFPIPGFGYRMLWHERSQQDEGHKWLREQVVAVVEKVV